VALFHDEDSSSSSSSSSTSGLDSSEESSEDSSDGELETPADRAGPSIRGVLSAHWTRVPLGRQIAACNRRWQLELPQRGAVSLATQHHLQPSTSSDDIDATRDGSSGSVQVAALTEQEREERLVKMMASQLSFPPSAPTWSSSGSAGGRETSTANVLAPSAVGTSGEHRGEHRGSEGSTGPGFSFKSPSSEDSWSPAPAWTSGTQVFTFSAGAAGTTRATAAAGVGAARTNDAAAETVPRRDGASHGVAGSSRPDIPAVPQTFVFRAGGSPKN
jgi:hypothetical protein